MTREQLEHAIRAAGAICGDRELYIVGSQAILGAYPDAHPDLLRSIEVDVAPKNRPELESLIAGSIGELSPFHKTFGFYVDGIEISGIVLPDGWEQRTIAVDNANTSGVRGLCLEPGDLAVSKLAAGRSKDIDFVATLLRERIVRAPALHARIDAVRQLDADDRARLHQLVDRLGGP
jgi:hypothetical protein